MFIIKFGLTGKEQIHAGLSKLVDVPRNKVKGALNKWRLSLSNEIISGLSGKTLKRRTGDLFKSAADRGNLTVVEVGSNLFIVKFKQTLISYAYAHEEGATLTPSKSKFLAIPLRSGAGKSRPKPLSSYKDTFIRKAKSGTDGYTVYEKSPSGKVIPIFLLRKKVKLPKRPWFLDAVERAIPSLKNIIEKAGGVSY